MLDLLPFFFYVHDYSMRFWYANRKAATYFGFANQSELIGRRLVDVDPDRAQAERIVERVMAAVRRHTGEGPFRDDVTLVVAQRV